MSCRRMTELISKSLDEPLSFGERLALGLHTFTCRACRRYREQMEKMRTVIRRAVDLDDDAVDCPVMPPDARERIRESLRPEDG